MNCEAEYLITKLNFPRLKKCTNKAICEREGKVYCGIHDPVKKRQRQEKLEAKKSQTIDKKVRLNIAYLYLKAKRGRHGN